MGGQTALNVAMALRARRRAREVRRRADRRQRARHPDRGGPRGVRRGDAAHRARDAAGAHGRGALEEALEAVDDDRLSRRSSGRRSRSAAPAAASPTTARSSRRIVRRGLELSPVGSVLVERSVHRLEGVRARGDARRRRQRRDRLLDREPRPDGRAHRRLDHRRAGDDADRPRVPGDARRGDRDHPRDRRRGRRLQHPVRGESRRPASSWSSR